LPAEAVSANTHGEIRKQALRALEKGSLRALFAVDIFNEGVDLPSVDTLLFLRPTESPVVFMQQLGRGLRRSDDKDCVTVLDFIGQAHRSFRFDLRYRAITGDTRAGVQHQVEQGFPLLPAGCTIQLDRVAQRVVLDNLKNALPLKRPRMVRELRDLARSERYQQRQPTLSEFLTESGLELEDVYKAGSWSALKREAGLTVAAAGPHEAAIGKRIGRILHVDDDLRLAAYNRVLRAGQIAELREGDRRLLTGLYFGLLHGALAAPSLEEALGGLRAHPALLEELDELMPILYERARHLTFPLEDELGWAHIVPLSVHGQYSTDEIVTAFGLMDIGRRAFTQVGIFRDPLTNSDIFLVTLEKSERDYSLSTRYQDYAISPTLFHWESQSTQTQSGASGQRYINHRSLGGQILIFVRQRKSEGGRTLPYTFLGPADYVSHEGDRPIQFVWQLRRPMPADFFREAKVVAA
jgi:hypothetical protein